MVGEKNIIFSNKLILMSKKKKKIYHKILSKNIQWLVIKVIKEENSLKKLKLIYI